MLKAEAAWLRAQLADLPSELLGPLLSIGSGTADTRSGRQPWIAADVFAPLAARGVEVVHHEHRAGPGVDVVGDLTDARFLEGLQDLGARSVLCANVLEHLADPVPVAAALQAVVAPASFLVVTVPSAYPYHPDPIDTMFRPSPAELAELFPDMHLRVGAEVRCGTLLRYARDVRGKRQMVANGVRSLLRRDRAAAPGADDTLTRSTASTPPPAGREGVARYLVRQTAVTCAVFEQGA